MDPPQLMDANLSATLENSPEPEGNDIRRAPAGYLVHSGRVIVRAVEVHHMNIRSAGLRTPAGPRPPAGSVEWWPKELASRIGISRVLEGNIRDRRRAPQLLQSDTADGPPSVEASDLWPGGHRRWQPSALMVGVRSISKRNSSGLSACRWLRARATRLDQIDLEGEHP